MFGIKNDGWNFKEIDEATDISMFFERVAKLEYELKNCRRGSYAGIGDTIHDLIYEICDIKYCANDIWNDLRATLEEEEELIDER